MSDHVQLRGLVVHAIIGCRDDERLTKRPLTIDLDVFADLSVPGKSDDITDAVDYAALAMRVRAIVESNDRHLLEAVAEDVADVCLKTPGVRTVTVTVHKPGAVPDCGWVAACCEFLFVEREKSEGFKIRQNGRSETEISKERYFKEVKRLLEGADIIKDIKEDFEKIMQDILEKCEKNRDCKDCWMITLCE